MAQKETSAEERKSAVESDYAALYAVAGLTDALAEALKGALAETQQQASKRITELQNKRPELSKQAKASAEELRTFVITLPEQFKNLLRRRKPGSRNCRSRQTIYWLRRRTRMAISPHVASRPWTRRGTQRVPRGGPHQGAPPRSPRGGGAPPRRPTQRDQPANASTLTPHPLARAPRVQESGAWGRLPPG